MLYSFKKMDIKNTISLEEIKKELQAQRQMIESMQESMKQQQHFFEEIKKPSEPQTTVRTSRKKSPHWKDISPQDVKKKLEGQTEVFRVRYYSFYTNNYHDETVCYYTKDGYCFTDTRGKLHRRKDLLRMFPQPRKDDSLKVRGKGFSSVIEKLTMWKHGQPFEPICLSICISGN